MAFPDYIAKADMQFSLPNTKLGHCILHIGRSDLADLTVADCGIIGSLLKQWWDTANFYTGHVNSPLRQLMSINGRLNLVQVTGLAAVTPPSDTTAVNEAGTSAGGSVPNESSIVTTWTPGQA